MTKTVDYKLVDGRSVSVKYNVNDTCRVTKDLMEQLIDTHNRMIKVKKIVDLLDSVEDKSDIRYYEEALNSLKLICGKEGI